MGETLVERENVNIVNNSIMQMDISCAQFATIEEPKVHTRGLRISF